MRARVSEVVRVYLHGVRAGIVLVRPLVVGGFRIAAVAGGKICLNGRTVVKKHLSCRRLHRLRGVWRVGGDAAVNLAAARIVNVEDVCGADAAHSVVARNDRLRLERFLRRIVADFKGQYADEIILNVDAVYKEKSRCSPFNTILRFRIPAVEFAEVAVIRSVYIINLEVVFPFAFSRGIFFEIERRRAVKQLAPGASHLKHTLRRVGAQEIVRFRRNTEDWVVRGITQGIAPVEVDRGSRMIRCEHHADIAIIQPATQ